MLNHLILFQDMDGELQVIMGKPALGSQSYFREVAYPNGIIRIIKLPF
jgi:PhoPQ-activated pathogenicity-related protein